MQSLATILGIGLLLGNTATDQNAGALSQTVQSAPSTPVPWSSPNGGEPEFEVATIKPSDPAQCCARTFQRMGRRFRTTNTNLKYLIQWAWNLQSKQVAGGPPWMDADRFDVAGEIDGDGIPNHRQWKLAMQGLLTGRFKLQVHHEKREMAAFALVVVKGGPKLTLGDGNMAHQFMNFTGGVGETMQGVGVNASMCDFIGQLQRIVMDRPIVDRTGLTGFYNISFAFTREEPGAVGMTQLPDNAAPNLFEALKQQLGLKLVSVKVPVDVTVIDHAELPGEN
jgi:uncharacterized protein (TIGR03435 family)